MVKITTLDTETPRLQFSDLPSMTPFLLRGRMSGALAVTIRLNVSSSSPAGCFLLFEELDKKHQITQVGLAEISHAFNLLRILRKEESVSFTGI